MARPTQRPPAAPGSFAFNLRQARERLKLTQEALAHRLGFKRTTPISQWERDENLIPEPRTIERLAAALEMSPAQLLDGVVTPLERLRGSTAVVALADVEARGALSA